MLKRAGWEMPFGHHPVAQPFLMQTGGFVPQQHFFSSREEGASGRGGPAGAAEDVVSKQEARGAPWQGPSRAPTFPGLGS